MSLRRDEFGFVRSSSFGRTRQSDLRSELGASPEDQVYQSSVRGGVRTSSPVYGDDVNVNPGDTFSLGPKITKAGIPPALLNEWRGLQRSGYAQVGAPTETAWGYSLPLQNFTLPGGVRTNAMVLLPKHYPAMPPIGFYIAKNGLDAIRALGIDVKHLFPNKSFYGAPNLADRGWAWFCLKFEPWKPGRYNLIGIVMMVAAIMSEGASR